MSDKELLELAAKSAGIDPCELYDTIGDHGEIEQAGWNPLEDDGDAFRLAGKLLMTISFGPVEVRASTIKTTLNGDSFARYAVDDQMPVLRRMIVECAAKHWELVS